MIYRGGRPVDVGEFGLADVSACPKNPAAPQGYHIWKGLVPTPLSEWAKTVLKQLNKLPLGTIEISDPDIYPEPVIARVDTHTWTYKNGKLVTGICIKGVTLFRPFPQMLAAGAEYVLDPATAAPDPTLALYDAETQRKTDWGVVMVTGAALATATGLFAWGIRAAGRAA